MKDELLQHEEILRGLQELNFSAEWFFNQWSNNKINAFRAFMNLSAEDMRWLIFNLQLYHSSQKFYYINYNSKIKACIGYLQTERSMILII